MIPEELDVHYKPMETTRINNLHSVRPLALIKRAKNPRGRPIASPSLSLMKNTHMDYKTASISPLLIVTFLVPVLNSYIY